MSVSDMESIIKRAYDEIEDKETKNTISQGLSGVLGFPFTLGVDVGVIAVIYAPMFNNIRRFFGRTSNQEDILLELIKNISSEVLFDLVVDKFLGNIALIGIYFNAICARTMTWRLGILFAMLSARGEDIDPNKVHDAVKLIRLAFPQKSVFGFKKPGYSEFKKLVSEFCDISQSEFTERISKKIKTLELPDM